MLIVNSKRIYKNLAPNFNEFMSISVNLGENEDVKFYSLDKTDINYNPQP